MRMVLDRHTFTKDYTIGDLSINGSFFCNTLEDTVREIENIPVQKWKIYGQTAIPSGKYDVVIDYSPHFKTDLPRLLNVPGFDGIRIHAGNNQSHTEGCILVGKASGEQLINSRATLQRLLDMMEMEYSRPDTPITIEIRNNNT